jgi:prepilin-type N-terminal cleavage/methylation domain-containing protein
MKKKQKQAFTLLELLVVIAMIGILISLGVASFSNAQRKARDSRRREDMKAVQNGLEQYYADNDGSYPTGNLMTTIVDNANLLGGNYFPAGAPVDPKATLGYEANSDGTIYCLCAELESPGTGNSSDDACSYTTNGNYFCVSNLQ